jgi:hypothetical protein
MLVGGLPDPGMELCAVVPKEAEELPSQGGAVRQEASTQGCWLCGWQT